MLEKITKYINSLPLSDEQKDYLRLMVKEEMEGVGGKEVSSSKYQVASGEGEGGKVPSPKSIVPSQENSQVVLPAQSTEQQAEGEEKKDYPKEMGEAEFRTTLIKEMGEVEKTMKEGEETFYKAEETYNKVTLSLKKNDRWLGSLAERVAESDQPVKEDFVELLLDARVSLKGIRDEIGVWWQELVVKRDEAEKTVGVQMSTMKEIFDTNNDNKKSKIKYLPGSVLNMIVKIREQYQERIVNSCQDFSEKLDGAAKGIGGLTDETSNKMKEIVNKREKEELLRKIKENVLD